MLGFTANWRCKVDFLMSSCGEEVELGVPAWEEDFVGDIDLARSAQAISPDPYSVL